MTEAGRDTTLPPSRRVRRSGSRLPLILSVLVYGVLSIALFWPSTGGLAFTPAPVRVSAPKERLLEDMGDPDPSVRRRAFAGLLRLGPLSCRETFDLQHHRDPAVLRETYKLHVASQRKYGVMPARCNGIEFLPEGETEWRMPAPGEKCPVRVGVRVTNVGKKPIQFHPGSCTMFITPPNACGAYWGGYSSDGMPLPEPPVLLYPGKPLRVSFDGHLSLNEDGTCGFVHEFEVRSGRYCLSCSGMRPGDFFVLFGCDNVWSRRSTECREWAGHVRCEHMAITIR